MKNKKKLALRIVIIVQLFLLLGVCTYAWFESNFDPVIYSDHMKITASDGLFIQLSDSDDADRINVKEVVRDFSTQFGLSQVSTVDSINFFKRKKTSTEIEYLEAEKNHDYINLSFLLTGSSTESLNSEPERYIYLKEFDLYLVDNAGNKLETENYSSDAIRINVGFQQEIDEVLVNKNYLLCRDNVINGVQTLTRKDEFKDENLIAYGSSLIQDMKNAATGSFCGYEMYNAIVNKGLDDPSRYGTQKVLYGSQFVYKETVSDFSFMERIELGNGTKVTLDIWLEGADPRCDLPISGSRLFLNLVFGSYFYKVNFDPKDGSNVKPLIYSKSNTTAGELPALPAGKTGWYNGNTKWDSNTAINKDVIPTGEITLEAK